VGDRCAAPTKGNKGARRCTRYLVAGTLTKNGTDGTNRVSFSGRIGGKGLASGSYKLTATAKDGAGNFAKNAATTSLTVVKK
jgi:hypothetical protein